MKLTVVEMFKWSRADSCWLLAVPRQRRRSYVMFKWSRADSCWLLAVPRQRRRSYVMFKWSRADSCWLLAVPRQRRRSYVMFKWSRADSCWLLAVPRQRRRSYVMFKCSRADSCWLLAVPRQRRRSYVMPSTTALPSTPTWAPGMRIDKPTGSIPVCHPQGSIPVCLPQGKQSVLPCSVIGCLRWCCLNLLSLYSGLCPGVVLNHNQMMFIFFLELLFLILIGNTLANLSNTIILCLVEPLSAQPL